MYTVIDLFLFISFFLSFFLLWEPSELLIFSLEISLQKSVLLLIYYIHINKNILDKGINIHAAGRETNYFWSVGFVMLPLYVKSTFLIRVNQLLQSLSSAW